MYASIRRYRTDANAMDDVLHKVDETFAETISAMDGFVAYECVDCGDGELITISHFTDRAGAEASVAASAAWIRDTLPDVRIERVDALMGDVAVSRAREAMLEPAHH